MKLVDSVARQEHSNGVSARSKSVSYLSGIKLGYQSIHVSSASDVIINA